MRTRTKALTLAAVAAVIGASPRAAWAQADTNPPLPNALLLVDTSGSMEYLISPNGAGAPQLPVCNPANALLQNDQNRWATLVSVLTGEIQNFTCSPIDRNTAAFQTEFGLSGVPPVDWNYYLKHNRIVSNGCVMGPNQAAWPPVPATTGGVFDFPANSFLGHPYNAIGGACAGFTQSSDGLLDSFVDRVRFGLMTFDNSTTAGRGFLSGSSTADFASGVDGEWSYFPGWSPGPGNPAQGMPAGCNVSSVVEVGSRNPAAPPWEGRAIGFGDPNGSLAQVAANNNQIQQSLLAVRPYGATPIAGMMTDAQYFLRTDPTTLPGQTTPFGPKTDPFVTGTCRKNFIVLLTDGAPNQDLRPSCTGGTTPAGGCPWEPGGVCPTGACPYKLPEEVAYDLAHPTDGTPPILTFVVGFAVSTVGPNGPAQVDCSVLTTPGSPTFDPGNKCANPSTDALKACCTLGRIAFNGGTTNPHFADDKDALRKALSDIFSLIATDATTRTLPTFGSAATGTDSAGFSFFSSFKASTGSLWEGKLERQRFTCAKDSGTGLFGVAKAEDVSQGNGDKFDYNINHPDGQHPRYLYTVIPPAAAGAVDGRQSIRGILPGASAEQPPSPPAPSIAADGVGVSGGLVVEGDAATFVGLVSPAALQVVAPAPQLSTCSSKTTTLSATQCRDRVLKFDLGLPDPSTLYARTSVLGSIYHSTPTIVGRPSELIRDESYLAFQVAQKTRATVLYTETTDGQLHAFKVAATSATDPDPVKTAVNNELWAFIPPAVLPGVRTLFPGVQQNLLDGVPVVRDIVLQRSKTQAQAAGGTLGAQWSTVLLSGFGVGFNGYYALDVTNPVRVAGDATSGPKFLWQLSTDLGGQPLFGASATPAMATVLLTNGSGGLSEVAIAILPGGDSPPNAPGTCPGKSYTSIMDSSYTARGNTRCYADADPSRSLTIVRLDTGEVIRRFSPKPPTSPLNGALLAITKAVNFDAPVIGVPVPYPNGPGSLSTRAFVGDRDGRMWRLDMSSPNSANWDVSLFFDAFPTNVVSAASQPIVTPPAVSVDQVGNPILYFSTGYQDNFSASDGTNVLWAVVEKADLTAGKLVGTPLWHIGLSEPGGSAGGPNTTWTNGTRVTGPISVFNGSVYFATYAPPVGGAVCTLSDSTVWGVDYASPAASGTLNPKAAFLSPTLGIATPVLGVVQKNQIIFGVGVTRSPPCFDTTGFVDDFVGYGSQNTYVSNGNGGDFQLVWQSSPNGKTKTGQQETSTSSVQLPPPASGVRITSWASVLE